MSQLCPSGKEKEVETEDSGCWAMEDKKEADVGGSSKPISETSSVVEVSGSALLISTEPIRIGTIQVRFRY